MPTYIRLTDYKSSDEKKRGFFDPKNRYEAKQEDFEKIPGSPIAYWVSDRVKEIFEKSQKLNNMFESGGRIKTHNNEKYVRYFWEVENFMINKKWKFYENGGESIKWYGNKENIVTWSNEALQEYQQHGGLTNKKYWAKYGLTWSIISTNGAVFRIKDIESEYSSGSPTIFFKDFNNNKEYNYFLSCLNSKFYKNILKITAPTVNTSVGDVLKLPIIFPKQDSIKQQIETLTQQNIDISKEEWDSRETSWDFKASPLLIENGELKIENGRIEDAYDRYCEYWREKFNALHKNEEELNRLFIDIYELQDELTPDVELKDITILKNEAKIVDGELEFRADEIIKQFISYAVGVMFGRYSLDHKGLHIANMGESIEEANLKFKIQNPTFEADDDNVIPILDGDWFIDDITERFYQFVKVIFGEAHYEENIKFIEDALGKSIRKYFVKDFYTDHVKRYKKRPIYWMFSSPKGSFQALIYMHRYKSDTVSVILNDYLRDYITKVEATKENLEAQSISANATTAEKNKAIKEIEKLKKVIIELTDCERDTLYPLAMKRQEIELDDGVKHNYPLFGKALKKVAGLN